MFSVLRTTSDEAGFVLSEIIPIDIFADDEIIFYHKEREGGKRWECSGKGRKTYRLLSTTKEELDGETVSGE